MPRAHAIVFEESLRVPADALSFEGFQRWLASGEFPETGRIDFLAGDVEVEMSPEDLQTHGVVKLEIGAKLHLLVRERDLGQVFIDRTRLSAPAAGLSVEPDVVVVLWPALEAKRVRYVAEAGRLSQIEGAPDLVVEVVSRSSESKDTRELPGLYARAGIPEFWRVDARGAEMRFEVFTLAAGEYRSVLPDAQGWLRSAALGARFRLRRVSDRFATWQYLLEHEPA